jgi:CheY-like chemotaxis protein
MFSEDPPDCPYCRRTLRYLPNRWFGHSVFECEQCGDFPDFRSNIPPPAPEAAGGLRDVNPLRTAAPHGHVLPRVLLVDDSDEERNLYALMLASAAAVTAVGRGDQALALAGADPPDVVVLDVMMPGLNGWETCTRLKADPVTARIPIIMLTSVDGVDVPARARQAGAFAVLMKPCPVERLILTINAARDQARRSA